MTWQPFLLNPDMDEKGEDLMAHLGKKYGEAAVARFGGDDNPLSRAGLACSPPIKFKNDRFIYPTHRAHALMDFLIDHDARESSNKLMEVLYRYYFEEGKNINDISVLKEGIDEVGVPDPESTIKAATDEKLIQTVSAKDREFKMKLKVSGVPFFIIHRNDGGRAKGFSGAQPADIIAEELEDAAEV